MGMKKIAIEDATAAQLRAFAELVLGLEVTPTMNGNVLRSRILTAAPDTKEILIAEEALPAVVPPAAAPPAEAAERPAIPLPPVVDIAEQERAYYANPERDEKGQVVPFARRSLGASPPNGSHHHDPKIEIMVPSTREKGGNRDVQVPVGGVVFLIRRDAWTPAPYRVYEALNNAVERTFEQIQARPNEPAEIVARDNFSYSFSTRNGPDEAELAAWRARTSGTFNP